MAKYRASYDFSQDPDCIYAILSDVERMSEFMPLCKRSQVLSRRTTADAEFVDASVLLRYREIGFERDIDLVLTLWPGERRIEVQTSDAAVGSGSARCSVTGLGRTGSRLLFEADYKLRNVFLRLFFGKRLLRQGMNRITDRVRQRAETLAEW